MRGKFLGVLLGRKRTFRDGEKGYKILERILLMKKRKKDIGYVVISIINENDENLFLFSIKDVHHLYRLNNEGKYEFHVELRGFGPILLEAKDEELLKVIKNLYSSRGDYSISYLIGLARMSNLIVQT